MKRFTSFSYNGGREAVSDLVLVLLQAMALGIATPESGEVVVQDFFTQAAGSVTNSVPWVDVQGSGWQSGVSVSQLVLDGSGHLYNAAASAEAAAGVQLVPIGPHGSLTVSATVQLPKGSTEWVGIGFANSNLFLSATGSGSGPWLQVQGNGSMTLFGGAGLNNPTTVLSGTGGLSNNLCTLVAATDLALPLTNWTRLATDVFDASGRFAFTNPTSAAVPRQFYTVQTALASTALWIPPEGAWLGAEVTNNVNGISKTRAITNHEAQIGRQLDILRYYHPPGGWTGLTADELSFINAGRRLFVSFKPDAYWSNAVGVANGGTAVVDAQLASLAASIASINPRRLMVCVWHEPENDLGIAGTTNQYVAMWHNVRGIFDANSA